MRGMGLSVFPVPLHKMVFNCGLVKGEVVMGVRPALPIEGVEVIVGNDLAGSSVWAGTQPNPIPPIVTSSPCVTGEPDESAQRFPGVFTACAVTRAMGRAESGPEPASEQEGAEERVPIPNSLLSVSRSGLVAEQRADSSLSQLFDLVLTTEEGRSAASGYLLQDKLLLHAWINLSNFMWMQVM
ncbi:uncharacterized protein LOC133002867 [Limanda limanda]|uniref:uncharacterized protein LOC133002867 n=1 Tax=Limanda limanda TaxID=27771 RepID=UPI0029C94CE9|nr:uncharacterized protein LOC133002867 [Limanda limanda]